MAFLYQIFLELLLVSQIYGAPNLSTRLEENENIFKTKHDNMLAGTTSNGKRDKRQYVFNFPNSNPNYPNIESLFGSYGFDHSFYGPYQSNHRQPQPSAPVSFAVPIFIPVLYLPSNGCSCSPNNNNIPNTATMPTTATIVKPTVLPSNNDDNGLGNRFSGDPVRIWSQNPRVSGTGVDNSVDYSERPINLQPENSVNNGVPDTSFLLNDDDSNTRPISLTSKQFNTENVPALEHGTVQGRVPVDQIRTSDNTPVTSSEVGPCDKATVICCHSQPVSFDCFKEQGCTKMSWNPCAPDILASALKNMLQQINQ